MRIVGIENNFDASGAIIEIQNFFPSLAAIARAEDAAFGVGTISMPERRDVNDVWVRGMNNDGADVARVFEADVRPSLSSVSRFVDTVAERDIAADARLARAGINHVGIRIGHGNGPDGGDPLLVKERIPGVATVGRFPDAAADRAKIIGVRLAGHAGYGDKTAAPEGPDEPPFHAAVRLGLDLLRLYNETSGKNQHENTEKVADGLAKQFHKSLRGKVT